MGQKVVWVWLHDGWGGAEIRNHRARLLIFLFLPGTWKEASPSVPSAYPVTLFLDILAKSFIAPFKTHQQF